MAKSKQSRKHRKTEAYDKQNIAYKFRMYPEGEEQLQYCARTFGAVRWLKNRMLSDDEFMYQQMGERLHNKPTDYKDIPECSWLREVDSLALCNAQLQYEDAWINYFNGNADRPVFKSRKGKQSFTTCLASTGASNISFDEKTGLLKIPKCKSLFRLEAHRRIKSGGVLKSVTVSKEPDGKYYASLLYEYRKEAAPAKTVNPENQEVRIIGLDMSPSVFYTDSDGDTVMYPKYYRESEARLAKEQRKLSHMQRGSNNYNHQKKRIASIHSKITRQRRDFLEKLSYNLVQMYDVICIEDLNMKAMSQSLYLGKSVHDAGWGMFVAMLSRKCLRYGKHLIRVDRWYPSSKTCIRCGGKHEGLTLSDRLYICPHCGSLIDRDWQAALNIQREGLRLFREQNKAA